MYTLKRCESTITNLFEYENIKILVIANQGLKFYYVDIDDNNSISNMLELKPTQDLLNAYSRFLDQKR